MSAFEVIDPEGTVGRRWDQDPRIPEEAFDPLAPEMLQWVEKARQHLAVLNDPASSPRARLNAQTALMELGIEGTRFP